jgi:hypothetical protein
MHGNRRYVKLAWIGLASGLMLASPARGDLVTPTANQGALTIARDGSPYVAYSVGRDLYVARRVGDAWRQANVALLPGDTVILAGVVVERGGTVTVLAQDNRGKWIALVRGRRLVWSGRTRGSSSYGAAGLTLDARGRPAVAYALRLRSRKTYLRLVTFDARGHPQTHGVTLKGFPSSELPPGAAPVLVAGHLHVVETYTSAAIDWRLTPGGGWVGQYVFASRLGSPVGLVGAVVSGSTLWSAWTQSYPELGAVSVLLTSSATTQETTVAIQHGIFVSLVLADGLPEIGAYDWVSIGDWYDFAAVVADGSGPFAEFDGRLSAYAVAPGGRRQILLSTDRGLEWFETPSRPAIHVSFSADASGKLSGSVDGGKEGSVELYREEPPGPRAPIATVAVQPDGSFALQVDPPTSPTFYRAVYREPGSGVPYASLTRMPVG